MSAAGNGGVAQAPCCNTNDSDFQISVVPTDSLAVTANVPIAIPPSTEITIASAARASSAGIGARASVDLVDWDASFTGETIAASAQAQLDDTFTAASSADLYLRPIFHLEGNVAHAAGMTTTARFTLQTVLPGNIGSTDFTLFLVNGGVADTSQTIDTFLTGPDLFLGGGANLSLSLILSTQVSGSTNDIAAGTQFGEADFYDTLTLVGFETYSDAAYSVPVSTTFASESGLGFPSVVPEPSTALLFAAGLVAAAAAGRQRRAWQRRRQR